MKKGTAVSHVHDNSLKKNKAKMVFYSMSILNYKATKNINNNTSLNRILINKAIIIIQYSQYMYVPSYQKFTLTVDITDMPLPTLFCDSLLHRFFFSNWFGQGSKTSYRYSLTRGKVSAVLDYCVIDYLFAQVKNENIHDNGSICEFLI